MRWSMVLLLVGCKGFLDIPPPGTEYFDLSFEDVSEAQGILGAGPSFGVGWGDVDGDGDPDLWSGNHAGLASLFINEGGGFTERRESLFAMPDPLADAHGVNFVDLDADGDLDLLESVGGQRGQGFGRNNVHVQQDGRFVEDEGDLGLGHVLASGRCPIAYDWNLDGRIDVFMIAQPGEDGVNPSTLFTQQASGLFEVEHEIPPWAVHPTALCGQLADIDGDMVPEVVRFGRPARLTAHGSRSGTLEDLNGTIGMPPAPTLPYDVVVADFDNDLDNDLFVTRWKEVSDFRVDAANGEIDLALRLLAAAQGVSFEADGRVQLTLDPPGFWSPAMTRLGSGCHPWVGSAEDMRIRLDPDDVTMHGRCEEPTTETEALYIGFDNGRWELVLSAPVFNRGNITVRSETALRDVQRINLEHSPPDLQAVDNRDMLYLREDGAFVEVGAERGLDFPSTCTSAAAADFDNDMDLDLYLVCARPLGNLPNLLLLNDGAGSFEVATDHGGEGPDGGRGDSVALADFDEDGSIDVFVSNGYGAEPYNNGPLTLLRNRANQNHWVEIDLTATASHPDAHGAIVRVTAGGITQQREVTGGTHHMAQHHRRLHLGMGPHGTADRIEVHWPSGHVQVLQDVEIDRILDIREQ